MYLEDAEEHPLVRSQDNVIGHEAYITRVCREACCTVPVDLALVSPKGMPTYIPY